MSTVATSARMLQRALYAQFLPDASPMLHRVQFTTSECIADTVNANASKWVRVQMRYLLCPNATTTVH